MSNSEKGSVNLEFRVASMLMIIKQRRFSLKNELSIKFLAITIEELHSEG